MKSAVAALLLPLCLFAADPRPDEASGSASMRRIQTYYANIPDFDFPCGKPELFFDAKLIQGIDPKKRFEFQDIRRRGGKFEQALDALEEGRKALKKSYLERLDEALNGYMMLREYADVDEQSIQTELLDEQMTRANSEFEAQYYAMLMQAFQTYLASREVQEVYQKYYDFVASAFAVMDVSEQENLLRDMQARIDCLRKERIATYQELMRSTILLEKGLEQYLQAEFSNEKKGFIQPLQIDAINQQLKRLALQLKYLWLVPQFSNELSAYRNLLWAHDRKLRNGVLYAAMRKAQEAQPYVLPLEAFETSAERNRLREKIAQTRAKIGYLTLLEDEAKTEATYSVNTTPIDKLRNLRETAKKNEVTAKDLEEWTKNGGLLARARRNVDAGFMALAMIKQMFGSVVDQLVMSPMQDAAIAKAQQTGWFDGGWKTSTEDQFEKYGQAINHFSPKIKFLEDWSASLSITEGQQYIDWLASGKGQGVADQTFSDLLGNFDFASRTRGGIVGILEVLCEDPKTFRALQFQSCRIRYEARLLDGRNRLARARGVEELSDPDKIVSTADLQMGVFGPVDTWSDVFFEIPSLVKNFFGQWAGDFESQDLYMESLERQRSRLDLVVSTLAQSDIQFLPHLLANRHSEVHADHVYLREHLVDYADAVSKIAAFEQHRSTLYLSVSETGHGGQFDEGLPMTPEGEISVVSAQRSGELEVASAKLRLAYLTLEYFAYSGNYTAAAQQVVEFGKVLEEHRKLLGHSGKINVKEVELEFKAKAAAAESVAIYESLLNEAITTMIMGVVSSGLEEHLLGSIKGQEWLDDYLKQTRKPLTDIEWAKNIGSQLLDSFVPGHNLITRYPLKPLTAMAEDAGWNLVKQKVAFELAQGANALGGDPNAWDQADFQEVVDQAFSLGKEIHGKVYPTVRDHAVESSVAWYANEKKVDALVQEASQAKSKLDKSLKNALIDTSNEIQAKNWAAMSVEQRIEALEAVDSKLRGPLSNLAVQHDLAVYRKIHEELETAVTDQRARSQWIENAMVRVGIMETVQQVAAMKIQKMGRKSADLTDANPAKITAQAESWKRILFSKHSMDDLEVLADASSQSLLRDQLLTPNFDINVLRNAFEKSIASANARENDVEVERIRAIAAEIDDIRIEKINEELARFLESSGHGTDVAMVIQGGAAKGNPEYQGLFADIDFTLMLHAEADDSKVVTIKKAMIEYFEKTGFRLASEGVESSMDSEGFVQKLGKFDSASADRASIIEDVMEKSKDPTRFYTEGGTLWFINNAAYSGKVLWKGQGEGVKWLPVSSDFGYDLAVDMTRYLGFLGSPKYSSSYLQGKSEAYQRKVLSKALAKTKYFIRLIDAYEIGHEAGNKHYNNRIQNKPADGVESDDASYHLQIYNDAVKMVAEQDSGDPRNVITKADLPMIERIAKMKMKGKYATPFDVIESEGFTGEAAIAEAHKTMEWMRDTAPKVLSRLADDFHNRIESRINDPDASKRNETFASVNRMVSVQRNIATLDSPDAVPLIVSKVEGDAVLTREQHEKKIADSLKLAVKGKHVAQELESLLSSPFESDEADKALLKKVDEAVASESIREISADDVALFQYEKLFKPLSDYLFWVAKKIP